MPYLPPLPPQLAGATVWAVVKELLLEPKEYTVFNKTLEYIRNDPRVTVRLGGNISGRDPLLRPTPLPSLDPPAVCWPWPFVRRLRLR